MPPYKATSSQNGLMMMDVWVFFTLRFCSAATSNNPLYTSCVFFTPNQKHHVTTVWDFGQRAGISKAKQVSVLQRLQALLFKQWKNMALGITYRHVCGLHSPVPACCLTGTLSFRCCIKLDAVFIPLLAAQSGKTVSNHYRGGWGALKPWHIHLAV